LWLPLPLELELELEVEVEGKLQEAVEAPAAVSVVVAVLRPFSPDYQSR
jgi:hypothetical protein